MKRALLLSAVLGVGAASSALSQTPRAVPAKPALPTNTPAPAQKSEAAQQIYEAALKDFTGGRLDAARAGFQKFLLLVPESLPALINLALVEQRQQRGEEAERLLFRVIQRQPGNATAWLLLGIGAYERNDFVAAHAHLAQAALNAPDDARAHQYLGATLARRGWYAAGEDELRRALELNPKSAEAHYNLALIYMERVPPAVELARRHYYRATDLGAPPDGKLAARIGE